MADRFTGADVELVAATLAGRYRYSQHGQLCPVWTQRPKGIQVGDSRRPGPAEVAGCYCWVLSDARTDARRVLAALTADDWGRRGALAEAIARAILDNPGPDPSPAIPAWWSGWREGRDDAARIARVFSARTETSVG